MQSRVKKNTYFVSIGQISKMALAFLLFPFATRYLGPDGFASYALASTIMYFVFLLNDVGMNTYLTREVSKDVTKASSYYLNTLITKLALILINGLLLLIFLVILNFSIEANIAIIIFAAYGIFTSFFELNAGLFRSFERMEFETVFIVLEKVITTGLGIYVLTKGWGLYAFCCVFAFGGLLNLILSTIFVKKFFVDFKFPFDFRFTKKFVSKSLPFGMSLFIANIYNGMGLILIYKMQPAIVAGWFATPARLLKFTSVIPMILAIAIFPALSRELALSKEKFADLYTKGFKYISFLSFPLIAGIFILSDSIALTVFGPEYIESIPVLRILALAAGLIFFNIFLAALFNAANKQKMLVVIQLSALILNIILNFALIPKYAHIGTAIAMLITEGVIFVLCMSFSIFKIVRLSETKFILKAIAAVCVMLIALIFIKNLNLFIVVGVSMGLYFTFLYIIKGFTISEVLFISNLKFNTRGLNK